MCCGRHVCAVHAHSRVTACPYCSHTHLNLFPCPTANDIHRVVMRRHRWPLPKPLCSVTTTPPYSGILPAVAFSAALLTPATTASPLLPLPYPYCHFLGAERAHWPVSQYAPRSEEHFPFILLLTGIFVCSLITCPPAVLLKSVFALVC